MARRRPVQQPIAKDDPSRIIQMPMESTIAEGMMTYSEHVILDRALPRVEDGLKPVQRRILYTMLELGTSPDKPYRKCARIVGDCLGKYHPHGDSSVYGALVRMAQDFSMRELLVDGHGNYGSVDGDGAAAMRYTEARMAPLALLMLKDIEKDTVDFTLNFDDSLQEPVILPARYPNLLVNGASGIAVGLATNIPTHNMGEAIRAAIAMVENPEISLDELMRIIPGPDFPTGGVLIQDEEIRRGYETGRSKLTLRAKVHTEEGPAGRTLLVITEIPYQVNKAAMLEKILKLSEEKKNVLGCIHDIRDESDRTGMRAVVELKKDADVRRVLNYLYKYSDLQVTFGVNMVAIADGKPAQMGLKEILRCFIRHQKNVVTRRTTYELNQARARAHILEGLMIAVDNLDEVIRIIRGSKNPKEARANLMEAFALTEIQAQAILDMRLQRLTNLEILSLRNEYAELQKTIARLEGILQSERKLMTVIRKELEEVEAVYTDPRRTQLAPPEDGPVELPEEKTAAEETVAIFTKAGTFKRMTPAAYQKALQGDGGAELRESIRWPFAGATDHSLYIFTSLGNCYVLGVSALAEAKPKDRGQSPGSLLAGLEDGEEFLWMMDAAPGGLAEAPDCLFISRSGMVKRTAAAEFDLRTRKTAAMKLKEGDRLAAVLPAASGDDLLLFTAMGMSIRFPLESVPQQGRSAGGVRGMNVKPEDPVVWAAQLGDKQEMVLFSDRGFGKRIPALDFETQGRGGKGVPAFRFKKNGVNGQRLAGMCLCGPEPCRIRLTQFRSEPTILRKDEIVLQNRQGAGMPYVMAVLDDVVTGFACLPWES